MQPVPFPLRIGIAAGAVPSEALDAAAESARERLLPTLLALLGAGPGPIRTPVRYRLLLRCGAGASEQQLARALAEAEGATVESFEDPVLDHLAQRLDMVVQVGPETDPLLALARAQGLPVIVLAPFEVDPGRGLNTAAYQRLDRFNAAELSPRAVQHEILADWREVFESEEGCRLAPDMLSETNDHLLHGWARADLLARRYQRAYRRAGQAVWLLFPVAVAAVATGALYPPAGIIAFPFQAALLAIMLVIVWRADRGRSLELWVEHRLLAERLRVAVFLRVAGLAPGSLEPPPHLGRAGRSEWISLAFHEILARLPSVPRAPDPALVRCFVARHWVGVQREFHAARAEQHLRLSRRLERGGHWIFLLAIGTAIGHTIFALGWAHGRAVETALLFLGLVLPGAGAAMGGFRAHREYSRIAKRSALMAEALGGLEHHLSTPESEARLAEDLRQVEQVIIGEVQDWVVLMRVATVQPVG